MPETPHTECDCGLDLTAVTARRPDISVKCLHDGTLGLRLHPEEAFIRVHPGDNLEVRWRLTYPRDGGPPMLYEIGAQDEHWQGREVDRNRADGDPGSGREANRDPFAAFAGEAAGSGLASEAVPDGFEPLIGYRAWIMTDADMLKSTAQDHVWLPGPQTAGCVQQRDGHHVSYDLFRLRDELRREPDGDRKAVIQANIDRAIMNAKRSPERNCMCGFYALLRPETVGSKIGDMQGLVYGRIKAWGKIGEYSEGFRAEKAQVDALYLPYGYIRRRKVKRIAKKYSVPVERPPEGLRSGGDSFPIMFAVFWVGLLLAGLLGVAMFGSVEGYAMTVAFYICIALGGATAIDHFRSR